LLLVLLLLPMTAAKKSMARILGVRLHADHIFRITGKLCLCNAAQPQRPRQGECMHPYAWAVLLLQAVLPESCSCARCVASMPHFT
jgi:hypothetical protein